MEKGLFSEWLPRYRYYLRMRNYSERTQDSYEEILTRFARYAWLRRNRPDRITYQWKDLASARIETGVVVPEPWITDFLSFLSSLRKYHPRTLHRIISTLSSFYKFLKLQKVVEANPVADLERPKVKGVELVYLKHSQVLELLASIPDVRDRLVVRTIYATGVRVSELTGIRVEDIDFAAQTIRVRGGKGGKIRTVFIDGDTLDEIRAFVGGRTEGPLFPGQMGKAVSPRTVQFIFKKYAPKGITPHKLRHSYASELYTRSQNLRVVQENLGHSSIKTTEIYLHTDVEERKKVYRDFFPLSRENGKNPDGKGES